MAGRPKVGDVVVVVSMHPNALPADNTDHRPDMFGTVDIVGGSVIRSERKLLAWPSDVGRFYEAECKGLAADGRAVFRAMRRLRITAIDDGELGGTAAPGIDEVAAFLRGDEPSIMEPGDQPSQRR